MKKLSHVDWRTGIESRRGESAPRELKQLFSKIDEVLGDVEASKESAWKTIREYKEKEVGQDAHRGLIYSSLWFIVSPEMKKGLYIGSL